jgi:putative redox protein
LSEEEAKGLEKTLDGYKEKIPAMNKVSLVLDKELIFAARTPRGYEFDFDPQLEWGCMPTESLLAAVAGCLAIDVVSFVRKMRGEIEEFKMEVNGDRNPTPPQYFKAIDIMIHIKGKGIDERKMDRAISLSQDKYCSVYHSLRDDMKVSVNYKIEEAEQ